MKNNKVLIIIEHADDASISMGGTIRKWAKEGKEIYIARVTNDDYDSVGLTPEEAIERNREECDDVYKFLGVKEVVHLGYVSDHLWEAPYLEIREKIIRLIRKIKPYTLVCRDIDSIDEVNMDHVIVQKMASEATWISGFDLHHVEHFMGGMEPYIVPEILYFMRTPVGADCIIDITEEIEEKIAGLKLHKTVMKNFMYQIMLKYKAAGKDVSWHEKYTTGELVDVLFRKHADITGRKYGFTYAEELKYACPPNKEMDRLFDGL